VSGGVESRDHNSVDFPLRRGGRAATPAVMIGAERAQTWRNFRFGGYYRWSEPRETNVLNPAQISTSISSLQGYHEPETIPIDASPVFVRNDNRATAIGGTAEITLMNARLVVMHERGDLAQDQYRSIATRTRPTDRWRASGSQSRFMLQRELGTRMRGTLVGSSESLDGGAVRSDLTGNAFDGTDSRLAVEADLRIQVSSAWSAAVIGGTTRLASQREDYVASISSDIASLTPFTAVEVGRHAGRASVAAGFSAAMTVPGGTVPVTANRQPNYKRLIAPALAYDAAEARAIAGWVTASFRMGGNTLLTSLRAERANPTSVIAARLQPEGTRSGWSVVVGLR
jgi:hypothetical protein